MKTRLLFILILLELLFSCKREKETKYKDSYTLVADTERIDIPLKEHSKNFSTCIQYLHEKDSNFLFIMNKARNSIEIYNLDARKLFKEVTVNMEGANSFGWFHGFKAKNLDTIIVVSDYPQIIGLIRNDGKVLKKISYLKDINGVRLQTTSPYFGETPYLIGDTLVICQHYRADETANIFTSEKQKHSNLLVKINLKTGECKKTSLLYPPEIIGGNVLSMQICKTKGSEDCLVYHFGILNSLFVSYDKIHFEQKNIETSIPLNLPHNETNYNSIPGYLEYAIIHDEVWNILYDNYKECYYLIIRIKEEDIDKNMDLRTKLMYPEKSLIVILDKNLRHMGDVILPYNTYSAKMTFITPEGLYISEDNINNPTFSEDYMRFRLFRIKELRN